MGNTLAKTQVRKGLATRTHHTITVSPSFPLDLKGLYIFTAGSSPSVSCYIWTKRSYNILWRIFRMMATPCASSMRYVYIDIGRHVTTMKVWGRVGGNFLDMRQRPTGYHFVTVRSKDSWFSLLFSDRREKWRR